MSFWERRRERKVEALGDSLFAILKNEHEGYKYSMHWYYFAQKLGFENNDRKWLSNARKPYFSIVSSLWARGFPVCVEEGKCWYPTSWKDAEPCLYSFDYLLRVANTQKKIEAVQRGQKAIHKAINKLPENERPQAVRQIFSR